MLDVRAVGLENAMVEFQHQGQTTLRRECKWRTPRVDCPEGAAAWTCRPNMRSGHTSAVRWSAVEGDNIDEDVAALPSLAMRESAMEEAGSSSGWAAWVLAYQEVEEGNALLGMDVTYWTWVPPAVEVEHNAGWRKHGADQAGKVPEYAARMH